MSDSPTAFLKGHDSGAIADTPGDQRQVSNLAAEAARSLRNAMTGVRTVVSDRAETAPVG